MNVERVNKVLSTLMTFRHDCVILQWEHLHLTLFRALGLETWVETWPGLCPGKLCACVWMSALRRRGPGAEVGFSGLRAPLWGGSMALPGAVLRQALSLSLPGSPSLGHGGPSGGLPGNHSNFPAPSGWVGRQVHLLKWFQGSGKKSAGRSWGCGCDLLLVDPPQQRTELPLDFQPSSPVSSSSQWNKTDRARQSHGGVFNIIMAAAETVHITQNQSKEQDLSGTMWGEETNPSLLSTVPGGYRNVTLGVQPAETWCPKQGSCHSRSRGWGGGVTLETVGVCPQVPGLGTVWASPHPPGSGTCAWRPHVCSLLAACLSPLRSADSELRLLPWLTRGPFSSVFLSLSFEARTFEWVAVVCSAE